MQINGATNSLAAMLAQIRQQQEPQPAAPETRTDAAPTATNTLTRESDSLRDIASRYDVNAMTQKEVEAFAGELLDAGLISGIDHAAMTLPPFFKPGVGFIDTGDQKLDLHSRLKNSLEMVRSENSAEANRRMEDLVGLMTMLGELRSDTGMKGVDIQA